MDIPTLFVVAVLAGWFFFLGMKRRVFPYLLVFVLGLEYFSPGAADSLVTIPKAGLALLMVGQLTAGRYAPRLGAGGVFRPLLLFAGYMGLSVVWSVDPARTLVRAVTMALLAVAFSVVQSSLRTVDDLRRYWRAFVVYALANAGMAAYQLATGWNVIRDQAGSRAGGIGQNPSEGCFYMSIGLVVMLPHYLRREPGEMLFRRPWIVHMAVGVLCAGVLITGSRGGIIALVTAIIAGAMLMRSPSRLRASSFARLAPMVAVVVVVATLLPGLWDLAASRMSRAVADGMGNRMTIWTSMWTSVRARPLFGSGLRGTAIMSSSTGQSFTSSPHNTPYGVLMDGGLVGLSLFVLLVARIVTVLQRLLGRTGPAFRVNGQILAVLMVLAATFMLTYDIVFNKLMWTVLALADATFLLAAGPVQSRLGAELWNRASGLSSAPTGPTRQG